MDNINTILSIAQVILSIMLIVLVLMQHGKGADAGAAFGSGASASVFGSRGSGNFLSKSTGVIATLFFIVCLSLAYISSHREAPNSVTQGVTAIEIETDEASSSQMSDLPAADQSSEAEQGADLPPVD